MAKQTLQGVAPLIEDMQPIVFQGSSIDPQPIDTNLLARGFANIEARQEKAAEKQQIVDTTLAKIEDSLHDDDDTRTWFADYKNQIKTEIDRHVANGDYGDAIRYATRAAGQVLKDTEVAGQVAANTKYKTFVDDVEKNKNIDRDTKDWAIDTHKFETRFVKDENDNTVRVDHGDYDWRPADQVDYTKMVKVAVDNVAKQTGSYGDATGTKVDANGNPIGYTSSYEKVDYNKLKIAMQATYEAFPGAIESIRQDKIVDVWKYNKLLEELENTPEDDSVKRTNLTTQIKEYKARIYNEDGKEKDEYEYLAYRVDPLLQTNAYNNTKYTKSALSSSSSSNGDSTPTLIVDNSDDLSTIAQGITIDLSNIGKVAAEAAIETTKAIKANGWLPVDMVNNYVLNNDYEGLADKLSNILPQYSNDYLITNNIKSYINVLKDQAAIAEAVLQSQESEEDKTKISFLQQATNGNVNVTNPYGVKYENYFNKLGGQNTKFIEYHFRNRQEDEVDDEGNKLENFSDILSPMLKYPNITASDYSTGWYKDANGNRVLRVLKDDIHDYNNMKQLNDALQTVNGKYSWLSMAPANYNITTECYDSNGNMTDVIKGLDSNQTKIHDIQKDVESIYNKTIDKAYSKELPTYVVTTPYASIDHMKLEQLRNAGRLKDTEYNNRKKVLDDKLENLLTNIDLTNPAFTRIYGTSTSDSDRNLKELTAEERSNYTQKLRQAVADKKYTITSGQAGFLRGSYIQINNDPRNTKQEGDKKYGTYTIFIPGGFQRDMENAASYDPQARALYNYSITQAFDASKRLATGAVISDIDEQGNAIYKYNGNSVYIDANTAKLYFEIDAQCETAIPTIKQYKGDDRQKAINLIADKLSESYGSNNKSHIINTLNALLNK